jgi:hypothetical protein
MLGFTEAGQVGVDDGGDGAFVAEIDLDLTEVLALFQQVSGVGVAQGVDVGVLFDAAGLEGQPEGALEGGTTHRFGGGGGALSAVTFGGEEPGGVTMALPLLAQESQRVFGQRDVTVAVALAGADVQEHALGIDVGDLEAQGFAQAQAAGVDGDEGDAMIQGRDGRKDTAHLGGGQDDGQFELGIGADQFQFLGPDAFEGFLPEQLEGADGLGAGLAGDFFVLLEMDAVLAEVFGREQVRGLVVMLAELADTGVIGLLGARADGQELQVIGEGF